MVRTRVLILAPAGRDAPLVHAALAQADIASFICADLDDLCTALEEGAGAALITGEAMAEGDLRRLFKWIGSQPSWSDFPFLVMLDRGSSVFGAGEEFAFLKSTANITLLERPIHSATLVSAVRAALRARKRQYEVEDAHANLERLVAARTRSLAEANDRLVKEIADRERAEGALRQAQKLESIGQLTSGVAHDFNNLLTAVLGNIQIAQRHIADESVARPLRNAMAAVERGAKLTSQLLAYSRKQRLAARPIDINRLVSDAGDLLFRALGSTIRIETELDGALWTAMVDPNQIELVLLNLAINGRDAMAGGGRLTIKTANVPAGQLPDGLADGEYILIAVSDTGSGMTEDVRSKAFEPFFTTKEPGKGSGLGLSMVHGVAVQSGGNVYIDSRVGEGTTVRVYLPRAAGQAAAVDAQEITAPVAATSGTILVVDDDADVRDIAVNGLREFGYQILEADSGQTALTLLAESKPVDLVVIDVAMPGMNGVETIRRAREHQPSLKALFVSGYADTSAIAPIGRDPLLQKPYQLEKLASAIATTLRSDAAAIDQPALRTVSNGRV